jgi:hypothetical protein
MGRLTRDCSELAREKMWSRIYLIPALTAEEDRDLVRRHLADQKREKELLGNTTSPYNSDRYAIPQNHRWLLKDQADSYYRYVRPTFAVTPAQISK